MQSAKSRMRGIRQQQRLGFFNKLMALRKKRDAEEENLLYIEENLRPIN